MKLIPHTFTSPKGIETDFQEIDQVFADHKYGLELKKNIRWKRFNEDENQNLILPIPVWEKLLGADANNHRHLHSQYQIMRRFLHKLAASDKHFSPEEIDILLITPLVHDWPEAIVGDLNHEYKTDAHEKKEEAILRRQLKELVPHLLSADIREQVVETVFKKETPLGAVFNLTEKIGYFRTAINSWMRIKEGSSHIGLHALVTNVFGFNLPGLTQAAAEYQPIETYLQHHHDQIDAVLRRYDGHSFDFYPPHEDREGPRQKFIRAGEAWKTYQDREVAAE